MTTDVVISLATQAMNLAFKVALPLLLAGLVVGLIVSVFQAVTQIQEQTLTFIPKILGLVVVLVVLVVVGRVVDVVDVLDVVVVGANVVDVVLVEVVVVGPAVAGPQFGSLSMWLGAVGRRVMLVPSGLAVKMSGPLRAPKELDEKTILVPSGDQAGSTEFGSTSTWPEPLAFIRQIELPFP